MSEMKPRAFFCLDPDDFTVDLNRTKECEHCEPLYDTTAFRALVERVCDIGTDLIELYPAGKERASAVKERARIRAALLAGIDGVVT